jgi:hypothetical protein
MGKIFKAKEHAPEEQQLKIYRLYQKHTSKSRETIPLIILSFLDFQFLSQIKL